jgi:hypothetical protein
MEKAFTALKSKVNGRASVDEVNKAFAELGTAVEKKYTAPKPNQSADINAFAEVVRSMLAPLQVKLSELESRIAKGDTVSTSEIVKSKALTLSGYVRPEDMIQKAIPNQPAQPLTGVPNSFRTLAHRTTGSNQNFG